MEPFEGLQAGLFVLLEVLGEHSGGALERCLTSSRSLSFSIVTVRSRKMGEGRMISHLTLIERSPTTFLDLVVPRLDRYPRPAWGSRTQGGRPGGSKTARGQDPVREVRPPIEAGEARRSVRAFLDVHLHGGSRVMKYTRGPQETRLD